MRSGWKLLLRGTRMNDITAILRERNVPYIEGGSHHHVRHGWIGLNCPQCSPNSRSWRLGFNLSRSFLYCWMCGHLPLIQTFAHILNETYSRTKELLRDLPTYHHKKIKFQGKLVLPMGLEPLTEAHKRYLQNRCFNLEYLSAVWGVTQGIAFAPKLSWRVFIPLFWRGKVVSWTTRSISPDASLRYVNAKPEQEAVSMKTLLYGEEHCNNSVIVHEGPTDAWRTGCGAVATMGATYTKAQILRLSKYPKRIICFDSESDAQKRAIALCDTLKVFSGTTLRVVLDAKDAGSATDKEIRLLRKMLR